ncbi:extracellular solute-binding protein [Rhizobium sp. SYY.PMSO]|uniref:extracellular solute-binding protein n=1 Tax=Rhizobium sp. SYY.PMSO TaxID=3382192 RepID=UPI00398FC454
MKLVIARISRSLIAAVTAGAVLTATLALPAMAQDKITLVWVGYGGASGEAVKKLWLEPFMKAHPNIEVIYQTGVQWAKLKAMRETGDVIWDLYEGDLYATDPENYFEKIDCTVVPCNEIMQDSNRSTYTIVTRTLVNGFAYDKAKFGDNPPKTWQDFFDLQKFPGKRGVLARPTAAGTVLMGAMTGAGVPRDQLVPYKLDKAFEALNKLRDSGNLVLFAQGPQCPQLLRDKEVVMAGHCDAGSIVAANEDGANLGFAWDSSIVLAASMAVVKGSKHPKEAMQLIAYILDKNNNAKLSAQVAQGPANTLAIDKVDPKYKDWTLAGHPEVKPLTYDWPYLRKDGQSINAAYEKWFSGN